MTTNQYRELIYALKGEYPPDVELHDEEDTVLGGITKRFSLKPQTIAPLLRCLADVLEFSVGNCQTCPINQKRLEEFFGPDTEDRTCLKD
jgi:hypothetical protein